MTRSARLRLSSFRVRPFSFRNRSAGGGSLAESDAQETISVPRRVTSSDSDVVWRLSREPGDPPVIHAVENIEGQRPVQADRETVSTEFCVSGTGIRLTLKADCR